MMSDFARDGLALDSEDRLPWLEAADDVDESDSVSPLKLLGFVIAGLVLLGAIVGGVYWFQNRDSSGGEGPLIAAQEGNYKVRAEDADAKKFDGEGDTSFATSQGSETVGRIDPSKLPEAPVVGTPKSASAPAANTTPAPDKPGNRVTAPVVDATGARTGSMTPQPAATSTGSGMAIQLGAYGSANGAKEAWSKLSKRFPYIAALTMSVQPTTNAAGATLYRLRAAAPSANEARSLCGKLTVAGENCLVVR